MSPVTRRGRHEIEVRIATDPDGRPAILLQLPDGFVLMRHADEARGLAVLLIEAADELEGGASS